MTVEIPRKPVQQPAVDCNGATGMPSWWPLHNLHMRQPGYVPGPVSMQDSVSRMAHR